MLNMEAGSQLKDKRFLVYSRRIYYYFNTMAAFFVQKKVSRGGR